MWLMSADLAKTFFVWGIRISFIVAVLFAFIVVLNFAQSLLLVGFNSNVLTDVFALVQVWLPFNLNVLLSWTTTAASAYIIYRLAVAGLTFLNRLMNNS